ncbi:MAG: BLUF domain-containing protein [Rubrivivax sp.]|nr:BLUF domain-containing protein [Rubrivivax sp.]
MNSTHLPPGDEPVPGLGLPLLYNLVYCSVATAGVDDAAVDRIVATAQRLNPRHGITGWLVFGRGIFFQWLEGPRDSVQALMATLRADPRHTNVICLSESEEQRERLFPDWGMERVSADDVREVLQDALDTSESAQHRLALGDLLMQLDAGGLPALGRAA